MQFEIWKPQTILFRIHFYTNSLLGGKGKISGFRGRMCEPRPVTTKPYYVGLTWSAGQPTAYDCCLLPASAAWCSGNAFFIYPLSSIPLGLLVQFNLTFSPTSVAPAPGNPWGGHLRQVLWYRRWYYTEFPLPSPSALSISPASWVWSSRRGNK